MGILGKLKHMHYKRYTDEFRAQAVALVGLGKPVAQVAAELGIGTSVLYRWLDVRALRNETSHSAPNGIAAGLEPANDELRRLRKEVTHLQLENDILKKAAVILGTRPQPHAGR